MFVFPQCFAIMTQENTCRHEYVKIFQRRLKGLERRMVATRAYLPVGFKPVDLAHLSEGSYCFCTKCRARLFPRRTQAEKAQARLALAAGKRQGETLEAKDDVVLESNEGEQSAQEIHVEELELESVDMQDIAAEGVKLSDEENSCELMSDEEL